MKTRIAIVVLICFTQLSTVEGVGGGRRLRGRPLDNRIHQTKQRAKRRQESRRRAATTEDSAPRIIGGDDAPAGRYPFVAEFALGCGGSLVAADIILTVAHCYELIRSSDYAYVGSNQLRQGRRREISRLIQHPQYNKDTSQYDFLLVKLNRPLPATYEPVRLNDRFETPGMIPPVKKENGKGDDNNNAAPLGEVLTVIGFGVKEEGDSYMASVLQEAQVPYISQETCQDWYSGEVVDEKTMFCAGYKNGGVDSCQGDSGGPILNSDGIQVGVVSWGQGCARKESPGVYGRVSEVHSWIQQNVCEFASIKPDFCFVSTPSDNSGVDPNPGAAIIPGGAVIPPILGEEGKHVIELDIKYDANPNQVAWILVKTDDDRIIDYVGYGDMRVPYEEVNQRYEGLQAGQYTFLVTDSAGNGMCCDSGYGSMMINEILPDGSARLIWLSSGGWGDGTTQKFELGAPPESSVTVSRTRNGGT